MSTSKLTVEDATVTWDDELVATVAWFAPGDDDMRSATFAVAFVGIESPGSGDRLYSIDHLTGDVPDEVLGDLQRRIANSAGRHPYLGSVRS